MPRRESPTPWRTERAAREAIRLLARFPWYVAAVENELAWQFPRERRLR